MRTNKIRKYVDMNTNLFVSGFLHEAHFEKTFQTSLTRIVSDKFKELIQTLFTNISRGQLNLNILRGCPLFGLPLPQQYSYLFTLYSMHQTSCFCIQYVESKDISLPSLSVCLQLNKHL